MEIALRYSLLLGINCPWEISRVEEARKLLDMHGHQVEAIKNRAAERGLKRRKPMRFGSPLHQLARRSAGWPRA